MIVIVILSINTVCFADLIPIDPINGNRLPYPNPIQEEENEDNIKTIIIVGMGIFVIATCSVILIKILKKGDNDEKDL